MFLWQREWRGGEIEPGGWNCAVKLWIQQLARERETEGPVCVGGGGGGPGILRVRVRV
jgi:hypothetical protein